MECARRSRRINTHTGITLPNFFASEKSASGGYAFSSEKGVTGVGNVRVEEEGQDEGQGGDEDADASDDGGGGKPTQSAMSEASTASEREAPSPQYWTPASTMPQSQAATLDALPPMFPMAGAGVLDLSRIELPQAGPHGPPRSSPRIVSERALAECVSSLASSARGSYDPPPSTGQNFVSSPAPAGPPPVSMPAVGPLPASRAQAFAASPPATPGRFKKMI